MINSQILELLNKSMPINDNFVKKDNNIDIPDFNIHIDKGTFIFYINTNQPSSITKDKILK